jgi:phosphosulfolactate synthase (CoM biosynthesis protein A)
MAMKIITCGWVEVRPYKRKRYIQYNLNEWDGKVDIETGAQKPRKSLVGKVDNILEYINEHLNEGWELLAIKNIKNGTSWHLRKRDEVEQTAPTNLKAASLGDMLDSLKKNK